MEIRYPHGTTLRPNSTLCQCHHRAVDKRRYIEQFRNYIHLLFADSTSGNLADSDLQRLLPRAIAPSGNATLCIATFCTVILGFNSVSSCKKLIFASLDFAKEGNVTQNYRSTLAPSMAKQRDEAPFDRKGKLPPICRYLLSTHLSDIVEGANRLLF